MILNKFKIIKEVYFFIQLLNNLKKRVIIDVYSSTKKNLFSILLLLSICSFQNLFSSSNCKLYFVHELNIDEKAAYNILQKKILQSVDTNYKIDFFKKLNMCSYKENVRFKVRCFLKDKKNIKDLFLEISAVLNKKNNEYSSLLEKIKVKDSVYLFNFDIWGDLYGKDSSIFYISEFNKINTFFQIHELTNEDYKLPHEDSGWIVNYYPNGFAMVRNFKIGNKNNWKIIDKNGNFINPEFEIIQYNFSHFGLCLYFDSFAFFFNPNEKKRISDTFQKISSFSLKEGSNYIIVKKSKKYSLIDKSLNPIIPFDFDIIESRLDCSINFLIATNQNGSRLLDLKNPLKETKYFDEIMFERRTYEPIFLFKNKGKYGIMDSNYFELIKPQYDKISSKFLPNNLYTICNKNKCAIYNINTGKITTKFEIDSIFNKGYPFDLILIKRSGKYGLLDNNGKVVLKIKYKKIEFNKEKRGYIITRYKKEKYWKLNK